MTFTPTTLDTVKADMALVPGDEAFLWLSGVEDDNGKSWCHWRDLAKPDIERVFGAADKCKPSPSPPISPVSRHSRS